MTIAIHAIYYHPEVGGLESHVRDLAEEFVARGHRVTVVCGRSIPGLPTEETLNGVRVMRRAWFGRNAPGWFLYTLFSVPAFLRLARRADVVHAQGFASALPAGLARRLHGVPAVLTIHTSHFIRLSRRRLLAPFFRILFAPFDHIFANDRERAAAAQSLAPHREVERYTNAVNTDRFRPVEPTLRAEGSAVIVCPARLAPVKGVEYAVRAMPLLLRRRPVRLFVAGDGPQRQELESLARELGVESAVTFLGTRPAAEMPGILSSADVVLLPSLFEATSIAALEAMACERVVAASRVGGLPEIVDDETGTLFESRNPEDLAARVLGLLERDRARMGKAARRRVVERWNTQRLADINLAVYRRVIGPERRDDA